MKIIKCIVCNGTGIQQVFDPDTNMWKKSPYPCSKCDGAGKLLRSVKKDPNGTRFMPEVRDYKINDERFKY
jgi:DnaJ-class molecular chaperone